MCVVADETHNFRVVSHNARALRLRDPNPAAQRNGRQSKLRISPELSKFTFLK